MPQSLSQIYLHVVFSTKLRKQWLDPIVRPKLFAYTATVLNNLGCVPTEVGGYTDHLHILCSLSRTMSPAELVEEIKKPTSKWIKTQGEAFHDFFGKEGMARFPLADRTSARSASTSCGRTNITKR